MKPVLKRMALAAMALVAGAPVFAQERIDGHVAVLGAPIVGAEVTAWRAGADAPRALVSATTDAEGAFTLSLADDADDRGVLYLVARGGEAVSAAG